MIRLLKQYYSTQDVVLFMGESLLLLLGVLIASTVHCLRFDYLPSHLWILLFKGLLIVVICQLVFYYNDLYTLEATSCPLRLGLKLIQSLGLASIMLGAICYLMPGVPMGRGTLFSDICVIGFVICCWRLFSRWLVNKNGLTQKVLIMGNGHVAQDVAKEVLNRKNSGFEILGFVDRHPRKLNPQALGTYDQLGQILKGNGQVRLVVAMDDRRGMLPLNELIACKMQGIAIEDHISFLEKLTGKLMVESLNPSHLIFSDGFKKSKIMLFIRRVVELLLSSVLLIIFMPFIALISLLIKVDSEGLLLFKQGRVGENGKSFNIYKFRSMTRDAEEESGPVWAQENDPRITRVGKYLRKFRLDEIPQLWNVLKGDMSFIGPRPERPCFVEELTKRIPYYSQRHSVKPGITGWAQIKYSYGASVEDALEKLKYELYYIKNMSPFFDLFIILETIKIVLFGRGAR